MPLWQNVPVFLSGTALVAQAPNNAVTGGNARGANATDWQTSRSAATQVASGQFSTTSGGFSNTASALYATVGGGWSNSVTAQSATVGGGQFNAAALAHATVAGGNNNAANGVASWVPGGIGGSARGLSSVGAWTGGLLAVQGDAQSEEHHLRRQTTDATATRLTADAAVAGTANTVNLSNFSAIGGQMTIVSKATGSTAAATWRLNVSAVRGNGVGTVVVYEGAGTAIAPTASNGTGSAWRLDIAADTTNGGVAVTVTGAAATTINWVDRYSAAQVATAS